MSTKLQGILSRAFGHGVSRPLYLALSLLFHVEQLLKNCHAKNLFQVGIGSVFFFNTSTYCVSSLPTENQYYYHDGHQSESRNI